MLGFALILAIPIATSLTPVLLSAQASQPSGGPPQSRARELAPSRTPTSTPSISGLPLRAAFYYPWFPEAWNQQGLNPFTHYHPSPGFYDSSNLSVIAAHIAAMQYGNVQVGIASWWGQGTMTDQRIPLLLNAAHGTGFQWTLYYEPALTASGVVSDLTYINQHYGSDPNFLHVNGKPVVFVYTRAVASCADVATWTANNQGDYLNLQVFAGYATCAQQPDSWHQYGPASRTAPQGQYSFSISPGYWKATDITPLLARDPAAFTTACQQMVASGAKWQLVTTFNEWGEGTSVESAQEWATPSGYGAYLDALHSCPPLPLSSAVSTNQYTLTNSDGSTWQEIDSTKLRVTASPSANQSMLLSANADLFTANSGFNQDLGIFVSDNGGADQLLAWKESGGFAGTYSPNAAYVQHLYGITGGHNYDFKLKWKANRNAPGTTIYAGAGPGPYPWSPTSLVAETFPPGTGPNSAISTSQYSLANSDGATWQNLDLANLSTALSPGSNATALLGANADLFTGTAGYNQDLGIFVSDNGGADSLVAWKESGGFAGTYSPNAAFVKAIYGMTGGHTYMFKLMWKTNKNAPGATIYVGAGPGPAPWSQTSLITETIAAGANPYTAVSTAQYSLNNSDGATWQTMDAALNVSLSVASDTNSLIGANVDLFTGTRAYNQDIGIFVSDNGGADNLLAWKESGGFAGIYSPNAAYAQGTYHLSMGHTYVFKLRWKTNKDSHGATIYAGAGPGPAPWSNTRVTVQLVN